MQALDSVHLLQSSNWFDLYGPFFVLAAVIILAIGWYLREGRNGALEHILVQSEFGSPGVFCGTLAVAEHQPGTYLRLSKKHRCDYSPPIVLSLGNRKWTTGRI